MSTSPLEIDMIELGIVLLATRRDGSGLGPGHVCGVRFKRFVYYVM